MYFIQLKLSREKSNKTPTLKSIKGYKWHLSRRRGRGNSIRQFVDLQKDNLFTHSEHFNGYIYSEKLWAMMNHLKVTLRFVYKSFHSSMQESHCLVDIKGYKWHLSRRRGRGNSIRQFVGLQKNNLSLIQNILMDIYSKKTVGNDDESSKSHVKVCIQIISLIYARIPLPGRH